MTKICSGAFYSCTSLIIIEILSSVTEESALKNCSALKNISSSITEIKDCTFENCSSLEEVIIPPSVRITGSSSFEQCSSLIKIEIPSSVTEKKKICFQRLIMINR